MCELAEAASTTQREIAGALGVVKKVYEARQLDELVELEARVLASARCSVGHLVVVNPAAPLKPDVFEALRRQRRAEVLQVADGKNAVNEWCRKATRGKIQRILDDDMDPMTVLAFFAAVYFSGMWAVPFEDARAHTFTTYAGTPKPCMLMTTSTSSLPAKVATDYSSVKLHFKERPGTYALVVLPRRKGDDAMGELVGEICGTPDGWTKLLAGHRPRQGTCRLPKMKLDAGIMDIIGTLKALGIRRAFDLNNTDFTHSFERVSGDTPIYVKHFVHRAMVEITEKGATAAATAGFVMATKSAAPPRSRDEFTLICDRPFLMFFVAADNVPLFAGHVCDP
jgi:serpin B